MNTSTNNSRFPFFDQLDQGIGQLVSDLFPHSSGSASNNLAIAASCWELNDRYVLSFDVPGVALDAIDLQVDNGYLEVSGERHSEEPEDRRVVLDEQPAGRFQRRMRLAKDVDVNSVDAELEAGVLTVTLKKVAQPEPQKVRIRRRSGECSQENSADESHGETSADS